MVHDFQHRHHWRHPRSMREAFGHEYEPLRRSFTFRTCERGGWCGAAIAIAVLALCIIIGGH